MLRRVCVCVSICRVVVFYLEVNDRFAVVVFVYYLNKHAGANVFGWRIEHEIHWKMVNRITRTELA